MSLQQEIRRIQDAKNELLTLLKDHGVQAGYDLTLDAYPALFASLLDGSATTQADSSATTQADGGA